MSILDCVFIFLGVALFVLLIWMLIRPVVKGMARDDDVKGPPTDYGGL